MTNGSSQGNTNKTLKWAGLTALRLVGIRHVEGAAMFLRLTTSTRAIHCSDHVPMLWSLQCGLTETSSQPLCPAASRSTSEEEVKQQERMAFMAKMMRKMRVQGLDQHKKQFVGS